jgi:hypothetical protein
MIPLSLPWLILVLLGVSVLIALPDYLLKQAGVRAGAIQSGGNKQSIAACRSLAPDPSGERVPRQGQERGR